MDKLTDAEIATMYDLLEKVYGEGTMKRLAKAHGYLGDRPPSFRTWVVIRAVDSIDELLEDNDVD